MKEKRSVCMQFDFKDKVVVITGGDHGWRLETKEDA